MKVQIAMTTGTFFLNEQGLQEMTVLSAILFPVQKIVLARYGTTPNKREKYIILHNS